MDDVVIRAEGLGKLYRIGERRAAYRTLRESLSGLASRAARRVAPGRRRAGERHHTETVWALRNLSFEAARGGAIGVIGRNGAGKSTLLKLLSRITEPTEGRAEVRGRVGSLLEVGTGFHFELTGRENVYLNGAILGMRKAEIDRKFDQIAAFSGVERFLDTPVKHYSSGMYVRLAFAIAAHIDATVLLVDEVLSVGDLSFQRRCLERLQELREGGASIIFVSHNLNVVRSLASSALFLSSGEVAACGEVGSVVSRYVDSAREDDVAHHSGYAAPASSGEPTILDVRILSGDARRPPLIRTGAPLRIRIRYSNGGNVEAARFGLSLWADGEIRVATLDTHLMGLEPIQLSSEGIVECEVPSLPLLPGRYAVRAGIYGDDTGWPYHRWGWDGVDVTVFDVGTGTSAPGGTALTGEHGLVHLPSTWSPVTDDES